MTIHPAELIQRKRDGGELGADERTDERQEPGGEPDGEHRGGRADLARDLGGLHEDRDADDRAHHERRGLRQADRPLEDRARRGQARRG